MVSLNDLVGGRIEIFPIWSGCGVARAGRYGVASEIIRTVYTLHAEDDDFSQPHTARTN